MSLFREQIAFVYGMRNKNARIVLLAERKDLFFVCQLHFPCHRGIILNDKGSLQEAG